MLKELDDYKDNSSIRKKIFCFDPTIHAGHILTAITILFCSLSAWYNMRAQVDAIKTAQEKQQIQIDKIFSDSQLIQKDIHIDIQKLQDDNRQWFMRLDDKLDHKADKKGF